MYGVYTWWYEQWLVALYIKTTKSIVHSPNSFKYPIIQNNLTLYTILRGKPAHMVNMSVSSKLYFILIRSVVWHIEKTQPQTALLSQVLDSACIV